MSLMHMRWSRLYRGTDHELAAERIVASFGVPYRTQFPGFLYGWNFYPDFLFPCHDLVLEIDDPSHLQKKAQDEDRDQFLLQALGLKTIRVTNADVAGDPGKVHAVLAAGLAGRYHTWLRFPRLSDQKLPAKPVRKTTIRKRKRK